MESCFLRAQIARIAQATVLVPMGKLVVDEESELIPKPLIAPEEYTPVEAADMANGDNWCHLYGGLLAIGRCTKYERTIATSRRWLRQLSLRF